MSSFHFTGDIEVRNAPDTAEREPKTGGSWIEFWRNKTELKSNHLICSSCGEDIYVDVNSILCFPILEQRLADDKKKGNAKEEDTTALYEAQGGHICLPKEVEGLLKNYHKSSSHMYITPLCRKCNNKKGQKINLRAGSTLVPENDGE